MIEIDVDRNWLVLMNIDKISIDITGYLLIDIGLMGVYWYRLI